MLLPAQLNAVPALIKTFSYATATLPVVFYSVCPCHSPPPC